MYLARESKVMPKIKKINMTKGLYYFYCPACKQTHEIGTDPDDQYPVWQFNGNLERPTIRPSVAVESTYRGQRTYCHSFVTDGQIQYLDDCTHELKGQTIELPDVTKEFEL